LFTEQKVENWNKPNTLDDFWTPAVELGDASLNPWKLDKRIAQTLAASALNGRVRSALVVADPLTVALGRPNREQVITSRPSAATTLQALELTNGKTLTDLLRQGAAKLADGAAAPKLIDDLYIKAFGRKPTSEERKLAEQLAGNPVQKEGVEDLLWAMVMLPEFQLIY
jgi:hypothetical protein